MGPSSSAIGPVYFPLGHAQTIDGGLSLMWGGRGAGFPRQVNCCYNLIRSTSQDPGRGVAACPLASPAPARPQGR